jgi:hypothetical protein
MLDPILINQFRITMITFNSIYFGKRYTCPSSEALLSYQLGGDSSFTGNNIRLHLSECEFCSAEIELLKRHPKSNEIYKPVEVPPHIRFLAKKMFSQLNLTKSKRNRVKEYHSSQPQLSK